MPYVIRSDYEYKTKEGKIIKSCSYFKEFKMFFKLMENKPENARQYEFITEARRDKRKYFSNHKGYKIEKI